MAKHIHISLGPKVRAITTDSPDWDESKHPRADNGQFGKGSGGGTKPLPGAGNLALKQRQEVKKQAHAQKMAQVNKQKTMMKGVGLTPAAAEKQKIARQQAQAGSTPPAPAKKPEGNAVAQGLQQHQDQSEAASKKFPIGSMVKANVVGAKPEKVTGHSGNMIHTESGQNRFHVSKAVGVSEENKPGQAGTPNYHQARADYWRSQPRPYGSEAANLQLSTIHHHDDAAQYLKKAATASTPEYRRDLMAQAQFHMDKAEKGEQQLKQTLTPATSQVPKRQVRGFVATAEKSQFGGYRPHVTHPDGSTTHLSQHSFETPEQAADYAEYLALTPGVIERGITPVKGPHLFPGFIKR